MQELKTANILGFKSLVLLEVYKIRNSLKYQILHLFS